MSDSQIAQLTQAVQQHTDTTQQFLDAAETRISTKEKAVDAAIASMVKRAPVTPNLLVDTKRFEKLCNGQVNTETEIIAGHADSTWNASFYSDTVGTGMIKVVTFDKLSDEGIAVSGDLEKTVRDNLGGSDFRVVIFDVDLVSGSYHGDTLLLVLTQGCLTFTGWGAGEFTTYASCFTSVLEHSGNIVFHPHSNMPASVTVGASDLSAGWLHKHASRQGWGGCHQPRFTGTGRMKVAIALPYIGFGDHGSNFVWAGSLGRYSHEDRLSTDFIY